MYVKPAWVWPCLFVLTACGGTSSVPMVDVVPVYAENDGFLQVASDVITQGDSLTAGGTATAALTLDFAQETARVSSGAVLLRATPGGELAVTLEGQTERFTSAQRQNSADGTRIEGYISRDDDNGKFVSLYAHSGQITDLLGGSRDYAEAVSLFTSEVGKPTEQRFLYAVVGTQTRPEVIGTTAIGSYDGYFKIEAVPRDVQSFGNESIRFQGDLSISVTADGTVSGTMTDVFVQQAGAPTFESVAGAVDMQPAQVGSDGFAGLLVADPVLAENLLVNGQTALGSYGGTFYGPLSEQAAGTVTLDTRGTSDDIVGVGFFTATQTNSGLAP